MDNLFVYLLAGGLLLAVIVIFLYNSLVRKRNNAESAWANIDVQLKRRYDLIPNLVESVKAYASHEREVFERIAQLRSSFEKEVSPQKIGEIDRQMNAAFRQIFALAEGYPELRASENFLVLQETLAGTENKIAYSRNNYNNAVMSYNTAMQVFPGVLIAKVFGFREKEFFEIEEPQEREAVKVDFAEGGE